MICKKKYLALISLVLFFCVHCGIGMDLTVKDDAIEMRGVITSKTAGELEAVLKENPEIKTLSLKHVPGSLDDEASLTDLFSLIKESELNTVVPADGVVASGGTDLLLMGRERNIESGESCIGVHTWADGGTVAGLLNMIGLNFALKSGSDFPKDDPSHKKYLDFYDEVNISRDFYWFTLESAPFDDIYFMSTEEIEMFKMSNTTPTAIDETEKERYDRCIKILDEIE